MIQMPLRYSFHLELIERQGLRLRDNTAEELHAAVTQMLLNVTGRATADPGDDQRHDRLATLARAYPWAWSLRLGKEFLQAHQQLLEAPRTASGATAPA